MKTLVSLIVQTMVVVYNTPQEELCRPSISKVTATVTETLEPGPRFGLTYSAGSSTAPAAAAGAAPGAAGAAAPPSAASAAAAEGGPGGACHPHEPHCHER
jgi:hypothetical protein